MSLSHNKYFRYLDKTYIIQQLKQILGLPFNKSIQFAVKLENERKLPFLDVLITMGTDDTLN